MFFGHAVIAWIFFLIFLLQNLEFWAFEGPFQAKKTQKDAKDDGNMSSFHDRVKIILDFFSFSGDFHHISTISLVIR